MLANDSLTLTHVQYLAERIDDPTERELVARYAVQEQLSSNAMLRLINQMHPVTGAATVALLAPADPQGRVQLQQYVPDAPASPPTY